MSKTYTLKELAGLTGGEVAGDAGTIISGVAGIREAQSGDITFLANLKYSPLLDTTGASAVITGRDIQKCSKPVIRTDNPSLAFTKVIALFIPPETAQAGGIHTSALIAKGAKISADVSVGAFSVIEEGACIGRGSRIYPGCFIGREAVLGEECLLYPNVCVRAKSRIGSRVIIHSGTVIGSDGFGFVTVEGKHHKIPQVGIVEIGDDVEIGANVAIDRARFEKTSVGRGTKIDNLVHIAHNVTIGENCLIVAQVGISGSTSVGNNVTLAGQVGVVGHITIGDNAIVMAQSGVSKSIPANAVYWGFPARDQEKAKEIYACTQQLPKTLETIRQLKQRIEDLEKWINKKP